MNVFVPRYRLVFIAQLKSNKVSVLQFEDSEGSGGTDGGAWGGQE